MCAGVAGGVALLTRCLPFATRRVAHVGYLTNVRPDTVIYNWMMDALRGYGWIENQNLDIQWAVGAEQNSASPDAALPGLAADLVHRNVDLIFAYGTPAVQAAKAATRSVPIVMTVGVDPLAFGLIDSFTHPTNNVTGMTTDDHLRSKRLEMMQELVSGLSTIVWLFNGANPGNLDALATVQQAAVALKIRVQPLDLRSTDVDLVQALSAAAPEGADGMVLSQDALFSSGEGLRDRIIEMAERMRLPTLYFSRPFVESGGLMSFGIDQNAYWRRLASIIDRILRGAHLSEVPVERATTFEFAVNRSTLNNLGLTLPNTLSPLVTAWID
jgi:ABC-type uncharacterized transport system substrate-binding protein